jgi:hypothetical protein
MQPSRHQITASILLVLGLAVAAVAGRSFVQQWNEEAIHPSPTLTRKGMLSDYHPPLKGTRGDTAIYYFESGVPGGTLLLAGGTHPNEPAGYMAAVTIVENLRATAGRVIVIPRANASAFSHNDSQDAAVQRYHIQTPGGPRAFRNGSRLTNPVHQWPDPTIYVNPTDPNWEETHAKYCGLFGPCAPDNPGPGGQPLAGVDSRNLNRVYPGKPTGTITEQVAHAVMVLLRTENVDLAIDYHEASLEYPTINVMVSHQRAQEMVSWAELTLADEDILIATESSSTRLRGLSHREWGDGSQAFSVLFESANPAMGRLKGRTSEDQIVAGQDFAYQRLQQIQIRLNEHLQREAERLEALGRTPRERSRKILQIEYPEDGLPLAVRVGRHVEATKHLVEAFNMEYPEKEIGLESLPGYRQLKADGLGKYLAGPGGERPSWKPPLLTGMSNGGTKP